jgi:predicted metal-dependent hydrolase
MRSLRKPQLDLRFDAAAPDAATRWHAGAAILCRGHALRLQLDNAHRQATQEHDVLHLPLPPQATPRQIQDRAEAWLRAQAMHHLTQLIAEKSALAATRRGCKARRPPRLVLTFARCSHWIEVPDAETVRCHWRLIEQPDAVIAQAIDRALAALPPASSTPQAADLFATADH